MSKVLIVDDDADFREVCRIPLEKVGFEVCEAADVESGFQKVQLEKPDLLILDVLMPNEYEGFGLARRLREELKLVELPILMLSAVHDVKKLPYRFAADPTHLPVDAFLDKPLSPELLVRKVQEMLNLHRESPDAPL